MATGIVRLLKYAWASPTTAVGLLAGGLTLCTRGRVARIRGTLEFHGGFSTWLAERWKFGAMTLGHVIIGHDEDSLDWCREHEHVHVRQVEAWGPFFIPAYLLASAWAAFRRRHYYYDNWFEIDARRGCGEEKAPE